MIHNSNQMGRAVFASGLKAKADVHLYLAAIGSAINVSVIWRWQSRARSLLSEHGLSADDVAPFPGLSLTLPRARR